MHKPTTFEKGELAAKFVPLVVLILAPLLPRISREKEPLPPPVYIVVPSAVGGVRPGSSPATMPKRSRKPSRPGQRGRIALETMNQPIDPASIGEVSKLGTTLLERASAALGWILEPAQIRRVARAKVDALLIQAEGEMKVTELHRRAVVRWMNEETRAQLNMETIAGEAIPLLRDDARPLDVGEDWITNFFQKCRNASEEEAQRLCQVGPEVSTSGM
jgi:hypothetical protein